MGGKNCKRSPSSSLVGSRGRFEVWQIERLGFITVPEHAKDQEFVSRKRSRSRRRETGRSSYRPARRLRIEVTQPGWPGTVRSCPPRPGRLIAVTLEHLGTPHNWVTIRPFAIQVGWMGRAR